MKTPPDRHLVQSAQGDGVLEKLVILVSLKIARLTQFLNLLQLGFVLVVVIFRIQLGATPQGGAIDTHGQRLYIP